jgi:hypothetical protein
MLLTWGRSVLIEAAPNLDAAARIHYTCPAESLAAGGFERNAGPPMVL